ncbi:MAG: FkbM family methyltransferase [Thermoproteota archaeon]
MNKIETVIIYREIFKNYIKVLLDIKRGKQNIKVVFRYDGHEEILDRDKVLGILKTIQFSKILYLTKLRYKLKIETREGVGDWETVFLKEEYKWLIEGQKDPIILDVGGEVGDTALYFALKGAKKVIVIEPFPNNYEYLVKNINYNNFQDKIIPINAMVGKENKKTNIIIPDEFIVRDAKESNTGYQIEMITLSKLIESFNIKEALLKMDCEGCEYESILNENDETLKIFKKIQLEYHYGYEKLKEKLEKLGFRVECTKPLKVYNPDATNPNLEVGYIYAERIK